MEKTTENYYETQVNFPAYQEDLKLRPDYRKSKIVPALKHVLLLATLILAITCVTWMNIYRPIDQNRQYGYKTEYFFFIVGLFPYFSLPVTFLSCFGLLLFNPYKENNSAFPFPASVPFLCFRVVTRGDLPDFVKKNAINNRNLCLRMGLENFLFEIVSDRPIHCPDSDRFLREIVVPKTYVTQNRSRFKARALNYCLECDVNQLAGNDWIVHLDEETLLTESAVRGILNFIAEDNADIGQGPISYMNGAVIKNWITTLVDSMRLSIDYALFRFQFDFLHKPVFGLKGSYIVLRNRVEIDVGIDNGPDGSIAEDCYFALKAWEKGYSFGFISGEMKEKSPFTIMDFVRQRRRWFIGQMYTVLSKEIGPFHKMGIGLSILCCLFMPLSLSSIYIDIFYPYQRPLLCCLLNGFVGGTFTFLYGFGVFMSCKERNWSFLRRVFVSVVCSIFIPIIAAIMESSAVYWGLFTLGSNEFFIVQKEIPNRIRTVGHSKII